ncbi:MAG: type II toxin-antitoxin system VapC family toxin [Bryobacterales bacterium]|nr:type II toxin-antitoxin system VapC family toxin [Bryobacterales bacterium]MDE0432798.1 type II toxin-antitoxin system VapC family toxin [Bryobacterales bacterium]
MLPTAYIETSVISYLTALPSRDVVIAAYQQVTREWWRTARNRFELVASELVLQEAAAGDSAAARARLAELEAVTLLEATDDAAKLTRRFLDLGAVPSKAAEDAAHIAIAVTNGADYLVTWNFRHIANAVLRSRIEHVCRQARYEPPVICTPNELMELDHADATS